MPFKPGLREIRVCPAWEPASRLATTSVRYSWLDSGSFSVTQAEENSKHAARIRIRDRLQGLTKR
jgi:hypothetical protein